MQASLGPERHKGSASPIAVDINRLAQPSSQAQCGLARDHCPGQLLGIQGEFVDHRFWLGQLVEFGRLSFFSCIF